MNGILMNRISLFLLFTGLFYKTGFIKRILVNMSRIAFTLVIAGNLISGSEISIIEISELLVHYKKWTFFSFLYYLLTLFYCKYLMFLCPVK